MRTFRSRSQLSTAAMVLTYPVIHEPVVTDMTFLSVTPTGAKCTEVFLDSLSSIFHSDFSCSRIGLCSSKHCSTLLVQYLVAKVRGPILPDLTSYGGTCTPATGRRGVLNQISRTVRLKERSKELLTNSTRNIRNSNDSFYSFIPILLSLDSNEVLRYSPGAQCLPHLRVGNNCLSLSGAHASHVKRMENHECTDDYFLLLGTTKWRWG